MEQTMEIRFPGEELASYTDEQGVTYRLFYRSDHDRYAVHHDDPNGNAWLEDGRGDGLSEAAIRRHWPELAHAL